MVSSLRGSGAGTGRRGLHAPAIRELTPERYQAATCAPSLPAPPVSEIEFPLEIDAAEARRLRDAAPDRTRIIDVREPYELEICHIEGAELAPLSRFAQEASERFAETPVPIVIYCHHGMRSGQAAHFLRQRGVENVWSLRGGIAQWAEEIETEMARY